MPDVFLDPRVSDYFEEIDLGRSGEVARIVPTFLNSRVGVLRGLFKDEIDYDLLRSISFPQTWEMKKFAFSSFARDYADKGRNAHLYDIVLEACGGDHGKVAALVEQFRRLDRTITDLVAGAFKDVKLDVVQLLARFSETRQENLHFDYDKDSDTHEAFRLYVNVDSAPRIWAMSHTINDLARVAAGRIEAEKFDNRPAEDFVKQITSRCFGGWHDRAGEQPAPRHMAYFDPGDVWFLCGRSVAHQVLYGHRVITTYVRIPREGNEALSPTFSDKTKQARTDAQGPKDEVGDWIKPRSIHPAADLKANWNKVFGETGTGRVRRFDARGMVQ